MRYSRLLIPTLREDPAEAEVVFPPNGDIPPQCPGDGPGGQPPAPAEVGVEEVAERRRQDEEEDGSAQDGTGEAPSCQA